MHKELELDYTKDHDYTNSENFNERLKEHPNELVRICIRL